LRGGGEMQHIEGVETVYLILKNGSGWVGGGGGGDTVGIKGRMPYYQFRHGTALVKW